MNTPNCNSFNKAKVTPSTMPVQVHDSAFRRFVGRQDATFRRLRRGGGGSDSKKKNLVVDKKQQQEKKKTNKKTTSNNDKKNKKNKKRSVRFSLAQNEVIETSTSTLEMLTSEEEFSRVFYKQQELVGMYEHAMACVNKILLDEQRGQVQKTGRRICSRGLEFPLERRRAKIRGETYVCQRRSAVVAVLQHQKGANSPDTIATAYADQCNDAKVQAMKRARRDAQEATAALLQRSFSSSSSTIAPST